MSPTFDEVLSLHGDDLPAPTNLFGATFIDPIQMPDLRFRDIHRDLYDAPSTQADVDSLEFGILSFRIPPDIVKTTTIMTTDPTPDIISSTIYVIYSTLRYLIMLGHFLRTRSLNLIPHEKSYDATSFFRGLYESLPELIYCSFRSDASSKHVDRQETGSDRIYTSLKVTQLCPYFPIFPKSTCSLESMTCFSDASFLVMNLDRFDHYFTYTCTHEVLMTSYLSSTGSAERAMTALTGSLSILCTS